MFGKHLRLKRFLGGIVVTAAVAVVAVPSALSSTSSRGGTAGTAPDALARYLTNHGGQQGYRFVTDTLGGTRHPVAAQQVQPNRFTSDTMATVIGAGGVAANGYNGNAYVNGGATPSVAEKIQGPATTRARAGPDRRVERQRLHLEGHRDRVARGVAARAHARRPPGVPKGRADRSHGLTRGRGRRRPPTAPPWVNASAHRIPARWAYACPPLH